jgi:hypothetical protein
MSKPMSDFQRQFLARGTGQQLYTDVELNEKLSMKIAEVMAVAIDTSKTAVMIEREACAEVVQSIADSEDEGEVCTALKNAVEAIRNRIPSQRQ